MLGAGQAEAGASGSSPVAWMVSGDVRDGQPACSSAEEAGTRDAGRSRWLGADRPRWPLTTAVTRPPAALNPGSPKSGRGLRGAGKDRPPRLSTRLPPSGFCLCHHRPAVPLCMVPVTRWPPSPEDAGRRLQGCCGARPRHSSPSPARTGFHMRPRAQVPGARTSACRPGDTATCTWTHSSQETGRGGLVCRRRWTAAGADGVGAGRAELQSHPATAGGRCAEEQALPAERGTVRVPDQAGAGEQGPGPMCQWPRPPRASPASAARSRQPLRALPCSRAAPPDPAPHPAQPLGFRVGGWASASACARDAPGARASGRVRFHCTKPAPPRPSTFVPKCATGARERLSICRLPERIFPSSVISILIVSYFYPIAKLCQMDRRKKVLCRVRCGRAAVCGIPALSPPTPF